MKDRKMTGIRKFFSFSSAAGIFRVFFLMLADVLCSSVGMFSAILLYRLVQKAPCEFSELLSILPFSCMLLLCNVIFNCYNGSILYPGAGVNKIEEVRRLAGSICITYLLFFAWYNYFFRGEINILAAGEILLAALFTGIMLPIVRGIMRKVLKFFNIGQTNILIAGAGKGGARIALEFQQDSYFGFHVVGFLDDDPEKQGKIISNCPVLGTLSVASEIGKKYNVNYVVSCIPLPVLYRMYRDLSLYFKHIMFVPANQIFPVAWMTPVSIGVYSGFEIRNKLLHPFSRVLKMVLELFFSISVMLCLFPLFLVLIPIIKFTSPGPVFYRSIRLGQNDKEIVVWKFRTMYADADLRLQELFEQQPELQEEWKNDFKLQNDPRITPVGKFLRKTSLDELPQFWNVLNGTMSIIGPRPIIREEVPYYGKHYDLRQRVKPGITGLWQVSGRSDTDYWFRVMLDTYYIMNWSIWMDYYIFFKTIYIVLMRKGAR